MDNEYLKLLELAFQLEPPNGKDEGQTCKILHEESLEDETIKTDPEVKIEDETEYNDSDAALEEDSDAYQASIDDRDSFEKSNDEFVFLKRKKPAIQVPEKNLQAKKRIEEDKEENEKRLPKCLRVIEKGLNRSSKFKKAPVKRTKNRNSYRKYKRDFFQCTRCNYGTYWEGHYTRHVAVMHATNKYKCVECGYECRIRSQLTSHSLIHNEKIHKCNLCSSKYKRLGDLQVHLRSHSSKNHFKCPDCDYRCSRRSFLNRHSLVHSDIKLFQCPECPYESKYKCNVKEHTLRHTNIKRFKCTDCDYRCNIKRNLERHFLIHTGKKLFKCPKCDYKCNQKTQLLLHATSHSLVKLFQCSKCSYECNLKIQLNKHMKKHK